MPQNIRELVVLSADRDCDFVSGCFFAALRLGDTFQIRGVRYEVVKTTKLSAWKTKVPETIRRFGLKGRDKEYDYRTRAVTILADNGAKYSYKIFQGREADGSEYQPQIGRGQGMNWLTGIVNEEVTRYLLLPRTSFLPRQSDVVDIIEKSIARPA